MLRIDLYSEITCPWCLVGHHRLDKVLAERFPTTLVGIRHHPVLLLPDAPAKGLFIPDLLRSRYGIADPRAAFSRPEAEARRSGLALDLTIQEWTYPTQGAHALILAAQARGTQHELAVAITRAYFLEAKNIADPETLARIAAEFGFEPDEARGIVFDPVHRRRVEREAAASAQAGVRSVPHFVMQDRIAITGGCSEADIAAAIAAALQEAAVAG